MRCCSLHECSSASMRVCSDNFFLFIQSASRSIHTAFYTSHSRSLHSTPWRPRHISGRAQCGDRWRGWSEHQSLRPSDSRQLCILVHRSLLRPRELTLDALHTDIAHAAHKRIRVRRVIFLEVMIMRVQPCPTVDQDLHPLDHLPKV